MELNPNLIGKDLSQAEPESVSKVPRHLTVGDGGSAWRQRAKRRAAQAAAEEATGAPAPILMKKEGPLGCLSSGFSMSKKDDPVDESSHSRVRRGSRERSRERSRGRGRSRSRQRKRDRSSPTPQRKRRNRSRSRQRKRDRSSP